MIALALHRAEQGRGDGPTLVVCPASLLGNWEAELRRFAPGLPVRRFHGQARDLDGLASGPGFVLTTYGTMRVDAATLAAVPWDLVVADEAQHVKNPRSGTARELRTIPSTARVALTGTPVENELTELWAILDWATPGLLGSRGAFRRTWAAPIEAGVDPEVTARFRQLVAPFLLRRRKSDPGVAPELPPKTETDHLLSLTREQVVLYEAFVRDTLDRIERSDENARRGLVLALLTGLKQICNHPAHFLKQGSMTTTSEKVELLDEIVDTVAAEGGAVLVFTQYVAMARLLSGHLERRGVGHLFLHGGTPVARPRDDGRALPGRRSAGLPALAQGRRHRPQPHPRRPRRPPRPLVEPRRRGPGQRPGAPDRADPPGAGPPDGHHRHHRAADRRPARSQAQSRRRRAGARRDGADRARRRRAARPGLAPAGGRLMATHPRQPPRRGARATTWWGKAWVRAVEEAAYGERDLLAARASARAGRVGAVTVEPGRFLAAVEEGDDAFTVSGSVPVLDGPGVAAFVEAVGAEVGRIAALLAGDLPHALVEHAEESGVELLPYGGELATHCSCEPWADPCPHALAVLYQLTWLLEADPFVLLALRGVERDELMARLHAAASGQRQPRSDADVVRAAAERARRLLGRLDDPDDALADW